VVFAQERLKLAAGGFEVFARRIELGPVARRQDDGLASRPSLAERLQGAVDTPCLEVQPLAQLDRRRLVAQANQVDPQKL